MQGGTPIGAAVTGVAVIVTVVLKQSRIRMIHWVSLFATTALVVKTGMQTEIVELQTGSEVVSRRVVVAPCCAQRQWQWIRLGLARLSVPVVPAPAGPGSRF